MAHLHLSNRLAPSAPPPPATRPRIDRAALDNAFAERVERALVSQFGSQPATLTTPPAPAETINLASIATAAKQHLIALRSARHQLRRSTDETRKLERGEGRATLSAANAFYTGALKFAESSADGAEVCTAIGEIYALAGALENELY